MAFFDDRKFLLSHIHHSFITSDDTGTCEAVMVNEFVTDKSLQDPETVDSPEAKALDYYANSLDSELLEGAQSYDIVSDMELIGAHRLRSNTAQRLDRIKRERQLQAKIKTVQWRDNPSPPDEKELEILFPKKDLTKKDPQLVRKSALSELLELHPAAPNNPFSEYARFDGRITRVAQTKRIFIYLKMQSAKDQHYPMEVISLANARVQDLIGLICWQYTNEGKEPPLKPNILNYCLRIAEETGEVDEDFPSLDPKELVAKFGFPVLALVERSDPVDSTSYITIRIEDEFTKVGIPNLDVTLQEVVEQIRKRKKWIKKTTNFHMEKVHDQGMPLSLDSKISDIGTMDFRLVVEDTISKEAIIDDWNSHQMALIEAPLYKSFNVVLTQKMGRNYDVQLGISEEKVEISPLPQKGAAKLLTRQQKPATYYTNSIASCEVVSKKYSPGKCVFKIVHKSGQEFKNLVFESDPPTGQDIVKKLQIILDMKFSAVRKEYQKYREQKRQKKLQKTPHSFSFS